MNANFNRILELIKSHSRLYKEWDNNMRGTNNKA